MKPTTLFSAAMIAAMTFSLGISADDGAKDEKEMTRAEKRLANVMEKYQLTGERKHCVNIRFLRNSSIIDDQTIFFEGPGKKAYINRLSHQCAGLAREERFMYKTSISQLCSNDIITVLDSFGRQWASCGLGEFEELEKKPKDKKSDEK